jgi:hypothetical protein
MVGSTSGWAKGAIHLYRLDPFMSFDLRKKLIGDFLFVIRLRTAASSDRFSLSGDEEV